MNRAEPCPARTHALPKNARRAGCDPWEFESGIVVDDLRELV